ncbi:MAG: DUF72 domain-containing protein [bacterium]
MSKIYIGTSGFSYEHWEDGVFYPPDLPRARQLEFYCEHFSTVELNVTFYRLPQKATFQSWRRRTPSEFCFAIKGSRYITHVKRLKEPGDSLRMLFENARPLLPKISVVLWQLPPRFRCDLDRLTLFVKLLKRRRSVRHAFEFRDESWFCEEVFELLGSAGMTVCRADRPKFDVEFPLEQPFEYIRRHGPQSARLYGGCYSDDELRRDAEEIKRWAKSGKDVFIYFNNDAQGWAVKNAIRLKELIFPPPL